MVGANVLEKMSGLVGMAGVCAAASMHATTQDPSDNGLNLMGAAWRRPPRRWIVKTESNVKREKKKLPDPPCVTCEGTGKVKCKRCCGRGRTNFTELVMLPKGEWPKWCWDCSGCGNSFCTRCFGTGEKRGTIGFHLPDEIDGSQN
jgi:hypothetical protein